MATAERRRRSNSAAVPFGLIRAVEGNHPHVPFPRESSVSADNYEEEVALGLLGNEAQLLREVYDALARIEQGTFGRCEECGKEIPRERLEALPYARYCLGDARKLQGRALE
jgi:RNA polymerase-binding transcription factor DksA